jgi:hypothetical protein
LPIGAINLLGTRQGDRIAGTLEQIGLVEGAWHSLGEHGSFELERGAEPPVPYDVEDLEFDGPDVRLSGSLYLPRDASGVPAVVYLGGSGDTTRGEGAFLADRLARAGIGALVYDKRGTGRSSGDWRQGGFEALAADATAALELLRRHARVDPERVGLVCQSQGCWVAPLALRGGAPARFLVAQSAPAVSVVDEDLDYYRVTLSSQGFDSHAIAEAFELVRTSQGVSVGTRDWRELERTIDRFRDRAWFKALGYEPEALDSPDRVFERHTLGYDPAADIDAIRVPSLWIYGEADTIITVRDSIARVRAARIRPTATVVTLPGAGHSFTVDRGSLPILADTYPDRVIDWIHALTTATHVGAP